MSLISGMGYSNCHIVDKPAEEWDDTHLCMSCNDLQPQEFGLGSTGNVVINCGETDKDLREAVFNGALTLDQVEAMLLENAVGEAHDNLSSAARMLGLTRPQIFYRLKRRHETGAPTHEAFDLPRVGAS